MCPALTDDPGKSNMTSAAATVAVLIRCEWLDSTGLRTP